ncbi:hypothetical protein B0H16DRAFT_1453388 [Mycena metata]|uniref:Uncharacterized protein n=1 Tax=Mycena metata TaxID=1033252 RepID=A0AAD7NN77_9AGAR|nr:hypothetical protein B0H16DRAFT_1453388 [Mycena metata]
MPSIKINGKNVSIPPLPLRPRTPAQKYAASNTREPHHGPLSAWLKNAIATSFPRGETDTTDLDSDEVLCSVHMRYSKAADDGTIFEGPDKYHLFMSIETPSNARVANSYNLSPYLTLGHWIGSHQDGDAPAWTAYLTKDVVYHFRQDRAFMARFVCGLTGIWVASVASLTVSPGMINWAIANAKGTRALSEVKYQRRRLIARLQRDAKSTSGLQDSLAVEEDLVEVQFPLADTTNWQRGNGCALDILFNLPKRDKDRKTATKTPKEVARDALGRDAARARGVRVRAASVWRRQAAGASSDSPKRDAGARGMCGKGGQIRLARCTSAGRRAKAAVESGEDVDGDAVRPQVLCQNVRKLKTKSGGKSARDDIGGASVGESGVEVEVGGRARACVGGDGACTVARGVTHVSRCGAYVGRSRRLRAMCGVATVGNARMCGGGAPQSRRTRRLGMGMCTAAAWLGMWNFPGGDGRERRAVHLRLVGALCARRAKGSSVFCVRTGTRRRRHVLRGYCEGVCVRARGGADVLGGRQGGEGGRGERRSCATLPAAARRRRFAHLFGGGLLKKSRTLTRVNTKAAQQLIMQTTELLREPNETMHPAWLGRVAGRNFASRWWWKERGRQKAVQLPLWEVTPLALDHNKPTRRRVVLLTLKHIYVSHRFLASALLRLATLEADGVDLPPELSDLLDHADDRLQHRPQPGCYGIWSEATLLSYYFGVSTKILVCVKPLNDFNGLTHQYLICYQCHQIDFALPLKTSNL